MIGKPQKHHESINLIFCLYKHDFSAKQEIKDSRSANKGMPRIFIKGEGINLQKGFYEGKEGVLALEVFKKFFLQGVRGDLVGLVTPPLIASFCTIYKRPQNLT